MLSALRAPLLADSGNKPDDPEGDALASQLHGQSNPNRVSRDRAETINSFEQKVGPDEKVAPANKVEKEEEYEGVKRDRRPDGYEGDGEHGGRISPSWEQLQGLAIRSTSAGEHIERPPQLTLEPRRDRQGLAGGDKHEEPDVVTQPLKPRMPDQEERRSDGTDSGVDSGIEDDDDELLTDSRNT